jgi:glycerol-3-phosphate acyltransferase PlsY
VQQALSWDLRDLWNPHGSAAAALLAYLLGSIPFGYIIVKLRAGRDVRAAGSGNIGATNVGRVAGAAAGVLTLLLDVAKGWLAVWLAAELSSHDVTCMMVAVVAAVIGHMFPVWLRFRGGKGVATAVGVFLPICWQGVGAALLVFVVVVAIWRYVSLGSILGAAVLPLLVYMLYQPPPAPWAVSIGAIIVSVLIIVKHRDNIGRLVAGSENRLGKKQGSR